MLNNKNIFVALTYKCNAFCEKCMTRYHKNKDIEMSQNTLNSLFNLFRQNNYTGKISVGTGEPLLYGNLQFFISNILNVNDKISLRLLTNGMLLSADNEPLFFNDRCKWGVTMDAFNQSSLDKLQVGVDIEKVKHNVKSVAAIYGGSHMYLNFTVYQSNVDEIPKFIEFATQNGIKEIFLTGIKLFKGYESVLSTYKLKHDDHLRDILKKAEVYLKQNNISTKGINIDEKYSRHACYKCDKASPIIDVDGSVSFCSGREDIYIGNILNDDIAFKWSQMAKRIEASQNRWCKQCFDNVLLDGTYRLPKTINRM